MKIKFGAVITAVLLSASANAFAFAQANSCQEEYIQMYDQITQYGSITSPIDNSRFNRVNTPVSDNQGSCTAKGYYFNRYICNIVWTEGNWGNTFHCG
jgi:hypothetical protein